MTGLYFPTVIISDAHLGKDVAQADMLLEFLQNMRCDKMFLLGDIIDGWHLMAQKHRKFSEMHARVLDAINRHAHQGTEIVYIAGNHDENLRARWSPRRRRLEQPSRRLSRHPILNKTHIFSDQRAGLRAAIRIVNGEFYRDPSGRRFLLIHGDQFDWKKLKTRWGQALSRIGDKAYDGLIKINGYAVKLSKKYQGRNFSIAGYIKKKTKRSLGVIENFERAVVRAVNKGKIDGIICGHIHFAEIREMDGAIYANAGDWVESATALVHDLLGNWEIVEWQKMRKTLGLEALPKITDENPNLDFRGITHKQLRWIQRLWPARNFDAVLAKVEDALAEIGRTQKDWEARHKSAQKLENARNQALPY